MVTEQAMVFDLNNVVLIFWILFLQVLKDAQLHTRLMLVPFFVFYYLKSHDLLGLMVKALKRLSKTALSKEIEYLPAIVNVVLEHYIVVSILVIISRVV